MLAQANEQLGLVLADNLAIIVGQSGSRFDNQTVAIQDDMDASLSEA
jgi:hypothetical protein